MSAGHSRYLVASRTPHFPVWPVESAAGNQGAAVRCGVENAAGGLRISESAVSGGLRAGGGSGLRLLSVYD